MATGAGRREAKGERTPRGAAEERVLVAVEELLREGEAFTTLPVGRIAERAGVARSSFYFHFPDKQTLLRGLAASVTDSLFDPVRAWVAEPENDRDGLVTTVGEVLVVLRRHGALVAAFLEVAAYDAEFADYWRARMAEIIGELAGRLEQDRAAGRLPADLETEAVAAYLVWGAERTMVQAVATDPSGADDGRIARGIAQAMWAVMGPRAA
ncbi:MAG: TetR/AcrR family transcriptional regulator [Burkholderiales bacterium]